MTLQQLKYLQEIARSGSINKAAKALYISQSTLSSAIRELESEFSLRIFKRTSKGVVLTESGRSFFNSIRPILEQAQKVENTYSKTQGAGTLRLTISSQHYPFCVQAFTDFCETVSANSYELSLNETNTYKIIEDVASGKSDLGIFYISNKNERFIKKVLEAHRLFFNVLMSITPHVFLGKNHPLSSHSEIDLGHLSNYPYVVFNREPGLSPYFSEELDLENFRSSNKTIFVNDRATVYSVISHSEAFSIGTGLLPKGYSTDEIISVPIKKPNDVMKLGYIVTSGKDNAEPVQMYLDFLTKYI